MLASRYSHSIRRSPLQLDFFLVQLRKFRSSTPKNNYFWPNVRAGTFEQERTLVDWYKSTKIKKHDEMICHHLSTHDYYRYTTRTFLPNIFLQNVGNVSSGYSRAENKGGTSFENISK